MSASTVRASSRSLPLFLLSLVGLLLFAEGCATDPVAESAAAARSDSVTQVPFVLQSLAAGLNEPAGYKVLSSRPCDATVEGGWTTPTGTFAIVTDAQRGKVCQTAFAAGFKDGKAPVNMERTFAKPWGTRLYVRYWMKVSSNWSGHPVVVKQFHGWINTKAGNGGGNRAITVLPGLPVGSTVRAGVSIQGAISATATHAGTTVQRNTWAMVEVLLIGGTNGHVTYWVDGKQVLDFPVTWGPAGLAGTWEKISWSPTYGGFNSCGGVQCTVPAAMQEWTDDIYVSGAP